MVSAVVFDFKGMLAKLTGIPIWTEFDGPDSGCGLDYWYESVVTQDPDDLDEGETHVPIGLEAYVNFDQCVVLLSVHPKDESYEDPEGTYTWRVEVDLDDPDSPYAAFVIFPK